MGFCCFSTKHFLIKHILYILLFCAFVLSQYYLGEICLIYDHNQIYYFLYYQQPRGGGAYKAQFNQDLPSHYEPVLRCYLDVPGGE